MSNSQKISAMAPAATPLSGAELVPIVQNGLNVKVPSGQIGAINNLQYQGTWNAATNSPTITSSVGTTGYYYIVSTAGNTTINGNTGWNVGDWIIFSNTGVWQKISGGTLSSIQISNDTSSNTNYNLALTSASSGYITTEYVDNGTLKFNPSTGTLTSPAISIGAPSSGTIPVVISQENTPAGNLVPNIGITNTSWLWFAAYDISNPDYGIYNYSLFGDSGSIGFYMSNVNSAYDKGNPVFAVNQYGAVVFGSASGGASGYGTAGQVLTSAGATSAAYWSNVGSLPSLREMKANIEPIEDVSWVSKLNPVSYNKRKQDAEGNYTEETYAEKEFGLIAEEVEAVNSELCFYKDGKLAGVNYLQLTSVLLKKVQDLEARLTELEAK
jgi:Chaperone of endosialidase